MQDQLKSARDFLKEQNLSQFAKAHNIKRAVLYDFLAGKNIRSDHLLKILQGIGFKIEIPDWSRFQLEKTPFDQKKKLEFLRLLDLIVEKYDPEKIILFGSQATGKWNRDSDFDLALVDVHNRKTGGSLLQWSFRRNIGILFDSFIITNEWLKKKGQEINSVESAMLNEGQIIYERPQSPEKGKG